MRVLLIILLGLALLACEKKESGSTDSSGPTTTLTLSMTRISSGAFNPFEVTVTVRRNSVATPGLNLTKTVSKGTSTAITDNGDGTYTFTVTPNATGVFPVTVSVDGVSISRKAIVLSSYGTGVGQPMAVPGDYVVTDGYEDGITITPDGSYLFVQYGPFNFSGLFGLSTICASGAYTVGYDLNNCDGQTNSGLVFNTIGPHNNYQRPNFSTAAFSSGKLRHLPGIVIGGLANGLAGFPTAFYGFKRQTDGTFAEPFTLAFTDTKRTLGPFGLSFKMNGDGTAHFAVAWNNFLNNLGDDGPDIYTGTLTMGQNTSLGTVAYDSSSFGGDGYQSITPNITPVGFSTHLGTQGNPHLYYNTSGVIQSIWVDDESVSHDISVYRLTAGSFPSGTWTLDTLPSDINTGDQEDQPFFTGSALIFSRGAQVVSHAYTPTNGACASTYTHNDCWGPEVVLLGGSGSTTAGELFGVGEPTIAEYDGKKYLYFVYVEARAVQSYAGITDYNLDAAFVEIP